MRLDCHSQADLLQLGKGEGRLSETLHSHLGPGARRGSAEESVTVANFATGLDSHCDVRSFGHAWRMHGICLALETKPLNLITRTAPHNVGVSRASLQAWPVTMKWWIGTKGNTI